MGFLSHWYLIVGLVIVLIIFGPGKLPQIGGAVGTAIKEFRKATTEQHDADAPVTGASFPQPAASTATHPEPEPKKETAEAPKA